VRLPSHRGASARVSPAAPPGSCGLASARVKPREPPCYLGLVSVAEKLVQRARAAGLPPEVADALERGLVPDVKAFLATAPDLPPSEAHEEAALLLGFLALYRPYLRVILQGMNTLIDAAIWSLDDLLDESLYRDPKRHRALRHLEEAIASFTRIATATTAVLARSPAPSWDGLLDDLALDEHALDDEGRIYFRGVVALLIALERAGEDLQRLLPWAWLARRDLLKSEAIAHLRLHELEPPPPRRPTRLPGAWQGRMRIADDFDAPLPKEIEDSFYASDPERSQ
jgi:hypothetical protein